MRHGRRGGGSGAPLEAGTRLRRLCNADIVASWAGPLAKERCTGRFNEPGAERDLDRAFDLALDVCGGDPAEAAAYREWLRFRTARLLREPVVWAQVEAVADALRERGELTGRQVRSTMDAAVRRVAAR